MTAYQGPADHQWYPAVWKLHTEIVSGDDAGIWRDVLVPEEMPLRILRYVLDQLYGRDPSADHRFSLPDEEFLSQTEDRFTQYCRMCGERFRFPTIQDEEDPWNGTEEERHDWLCRHYRGSYTYHGNADHFVENQQAVRNFLMVFTGLKESPVIDLNEYRRGNVQVERRKPSSINQLTMRQILDADLFRTPVNRILERLTLPEVLCLEPDSRKPFDAWDSERPYPDSLWGSYYERCFQRLEKIHQRSMESVGIYQELMARGVRLDGELDEETEYWVSRWAEAQQDARQSYERLVRETIPEAVPFAGEILYYHDSKDPFPVQIRPLDRFVLREEDCVEGMRENMPDALLTGQVRKCLIRRYPVCCGGGNAPEMPVLRDWEALL